jgi:hypothetical protein
VEETERTLALTQAVALHAGSFGGQAVEDQRKAVLATAQAFYYFLGGPASVVVTYGPIVKQNTEEPTGKAGTAMAQMHDDEEFDIELTAADAKGVSVLDREGDTSDDPTFVSDDESVFTYRTYSDNPRKATVVAGTPGSAVGTVTLGNIVVTHAVDVVPGDIATVSIAEGEVRKQA